MGGRPEKGAGAGRTQSLRRLCFPPSKGDCGLPNPSCKSDSRTQLPPTRVAWGSGQPVLELGACRSPTCVPSRAPHPHPAGSCCQPIPAGSLPAQVTRGVLGETEEGPARAQMPPGVCCQPPGSGARLPRARWAGEGPAQLRAVRARTKGRSVPREESAGIRRRRAERGDRSWAGGRLLGGAAGRARSTSPPRSRTPGCGEVAGPAGGTGGGEDLPLAAAAVAPALPTQPGRGRLARTPGRPQPPAAPGMQQTEREPLGWGGREEPGEEEEEGGGGARVSARGWAAAQLHPARLSGAARSIQMKRPDADGHSGSSRE